MNQERFLTSRALMTSDDARTVLHALGGLTLNSGDDAMEPTLNRIADYLSRFSSDSAVPEVGHDEWHAVVNCLLLPYLISGIGYFERCFERPGGNGFSREMEILGDLEVKLAVFQIKVEMPGCPDYFAALGTLHTIVTSIRSALETLEQAGEDRKVPLKALRQGIRQMLSRGLVPFIALRMKGGGVRHLTRPVILLSSALESNSRITLLERLNRRIAL